MNKKDITIKWPNGKYSNARPGDHWLELAGKVGVTIPTGCLGGSCGSCEIDVNGEVIRACINVVRVAENENLNVEFISDPYW